MVVGLCASELACALLMYLVGSSQYLSRVPPETYIFVSSVSPDYAAPPPTGLATLGRPRLTAEHAVAVAVPENIDAFNALLQDWLVAEHPHIQTANERDSINALCVRKNLVRP